MPHRLHTSAKPVCPALSQPKSLVNPTPSFMNVLSIAVWIHIHRLAIAAKRLKVHQVVQKIWLGLDFVLSRRNMCQKVGSWGHNLLSIGYLGPWASAMGCTRDGPSLLALTENCVSRGDLQVGSMQLSWSTLFLPTSDKLSNQIRRYSFVNAQGNRAVGRNKPETVIPMLSPAPYPVVYLNSLYREGRWRRQFYTAEELQTQSTLFFRTSPMKFPTSHLSLLILIPSPGRLPCILFAALTFLGFIVLTLYCSLSMGI